MPHNDEVPERWFAYLLECGDGTLYAGITTSLGRRLALHNRGLASKYTRGRRPVRLIHAEPHPDRAVAGRRERAFKKMSVAAKRALAGARGSAASTASAAVATSPGRVTR
jgi:predicted GIY-YIG superfamily endonuclease